MIKIDDDTFLCVNVYSQSGIVSALNYHLYLCT